jgi:hypothetical protein
VLSMMEEVAGMSCHEKNPEQLAGHGSSLEQEKGQDSSSTKVRGRIRSTTTTY